MKLANLTAVDKKLHMIFGLTFQNLHAFIYRAPPLFSTPRPQKDTKKCGFAISSCQKIVYLQKNNEKEQMETIITWAKENYQLIVLAVSVAGVLLAIISLILEVRKRKEKKSRTSNKPFEE